MHNDRLDIVDQVAPSIVVRSFIGRHSAVTIEAPSAGQARQAKQQVRPPGECRRSSRWFSLVQSLPPLAPHPIAFIKASSEIRLIVVSVPYLRSFAHRQYSYTKQLPVFFLTFFLPLFLFFFLFLSSSIYFSPFSLIQFFSSLYNSFSFSFLFCLDLCFFYLLFVSVYFSLSISFSQCICLFLSFYFFLLVKSQ